MLEIQGKLKQEIYDFLDSQFIMNLAVSEDNKPSSSILMYYVDKDLNIYFATHGDAHKAIKLRKNPFASFSIWASKEMLIQADGNVIEITDEDEKLKAVDKLAESSTKGDSFWPPLFRISGDGYAVFKIIPTWMRKLDLGQDTITQKDSPFTEV